MRASADREVAPAAGAAGEGAVKCGHSQWLRSSLGVSAASRSQGVAQGRPEAQSAGDWGAAALRSLLLEGGQRMGSPEKEEGSQRSRTGASQSSALGTSREPNPPKPWLRRGRKRACRQRRLRGSGRSHTQGEGRPARNFVRTGRWGLEVRRNLAPRTDTRPSTSVSSQKSVPMAPILVQRRARGACCRNGIPSDPRYRLGHVSTIRC